jgi:hypothetical protein
MLLPISSSSPADSVLSRYETIVYPTLATPVNALVAGRYRIFAVEDGPGEPANLVMPRTGQQAPTVAARHYRSERA